MRLSGCPTRLTSPTVSPRSELVVSRVRACIRGFRLDSVADFSRVVKVLELPILRKVFFFRTSAT
jgi:hypothetical protein